MIQVLRNRAVKILHHRTAKGVGTGFLLDPQHILTCAHVVKDAYGVKDYISADTPCAFSAMGGANEAQAAYIVHSAFATEVEGKACHDVSVVTGSMEKATKGQFSFLQDIVLLKTREPVTDNLTPINWQVCEPDQAIQVEGYGYHKETGDEFTGVTQGERHYGIHQVRFTQAISGVSSIGGASGTVLLASECYADDVKGYGMLLAEQKQADGGTESGYFIPGEVVQAFLASYPDWQHSPVASNIRASKITASKTVVNPKVASHTSIDCFRDDLPLSLIDRQFLNGVEGKLNQNGMVCLTLEATEADWFSAIGLRVTAKASILDQQIKCAPAINVDWPSHNKGKKHPEDMLEELLGSILAYLPTHSPMPIGAANTESADALQGIFAPFHQSVKPYDRIAIGIKLKREQLFNNEQQALHSLVEQLQCYNHQGRMANGTQVLLYLVVDSNNAAQPKPSKFSFRHWFGKDKTQSLEAVMEDIQAAFPCCYHHFEPLEAIMDSHIDAWIAQLGHLGQFDPQHLQSLRDKARQIVGSEEGVRHKQFRDALSAT